MHKKTERENFYNILNKVHQLVSPIYKLGNDENNQDENNQIIQRNQGIEEAIAKINQEKENERKSISRFSVFFWVGIATMLLFFVLFILEIIQHPGWIFGIVTLIITIKRKNEKSEKELIKLSVLKILLENMQGEALAAAVDAIYMNKTKIEETK